MQSLLRSCGFELRRLRPAAVPASAGRPVADLRCFLEDLKARGFVPHGLVDVGANRGDWTRLALSIFPGTPALLIEPQDEMEPWLTRLVAELPACTYVKAGAGAERGELPQTIQPDLNGSSFLPPPDPALLAAGRQRRTRIVSISDLLHDEHPDFLPDLVKLDIQGFELEALKGAASLFGRTRLFILETSLYRFAAGTPLTSEVVAFMAARGYEIYDVTEYLRRPSDGALGQIDLAFAQADGPFRRSRAW